MQIVKLSPYFGDFYTTSPKKQLNKRYALEGREKKKTGLHMLPAFICLSFVDVGVNLS